MKMIMNFLFLVLVVLISGCEDYSLVDLEQLDKYIAESKSNSFHVWYLEKEDQSFYYLKRKIGITSYDYFKLSKQDVIIYVNGKLPMLLKFKDIKKVNSNRSMGSELRSMGSEDQWGQSHLIFRKEGVFYKQGIVI